MVSLSDLFFLQIPRGCTDLNHEVELGVVIGAIAKDVSVAEAMNYVAGYALGLDMTARDWQTAAKSKGHPWSVAKGFDTSCPISKFIEKEKVTIEILFGVFQDCSEMQILCLIATLSILFSLKAQQGM